MARKETQIKDKKASGNSQEVKSKFEVTKFAKETKEELEKVVWPSRQQLLSESAAVLLMVTLVATVIYLVDNFFAWGAGQVF
jgi:preprotein translocase subunit SecE